MGAESLLNDLYSCTVNAGWKPVYIVVSSQFHKKLEATEKFQNTVKIKF